MRTPQPQRPLSEADLLSDEEWLYEMRRYVLGSFPLGWDEAKHKLLRDRQMRTSLMRADTQEGLHGSALVPDDEEIQILLGLLIETLDHVPTGDLKSRIEEMLDAYGCT